MTKTINTLIDLGFTPAEIGRVMRGVHDGKYNLLLGAGSSYGCLGGDGRPLLDGASVSESICDDFKLKLNDLERRRLALSYEDAKGKDANGLRRWMRDGFTGCTPTWQQVLFKFSWQRIWTFNIDDVLFHAFNNHPEENKAGSLAEFDWKESVTPLSDTLGAQQLVYLHGRASDLGTKNEGLIFSTAEYASATKASQQWHVSFQTHYLEDPFIVCGASLAEEIDISEAIRQKNQSNATTGIPSFIVSHDLDEGQIDRMRRYNLIPISCPLPQFFEILLSEYEVFRKSEEVSTSQLPPGYLERMLSQFRRLDSADTSAAAIRGTDFYGGDEPIWKDILSGRDAEFDATHNASNSLSSSLRRVAVLVHGHPVSGKTTALLRIALQASRMGLKPMWFRHEEGLNAKVVAAYLAVDENVVLFIDDAADHTEAIGEILKICEAEGRSVRIFMSARSKRRRGFRVDIPDRFRQEIYQGPLRHNDLFNLVRKRRRASRLGKNISKSDSVIVRDLRRVCKSELISCVSYIEFSEPLRQRISRILVDALKTKMDRELVARIACVHRFGFALPIRAALLSSGFSFSEFKGIIEGQLLAEGPVIRDERGVRLRHRILSEYAWSDCFTLDERYAAMSAVVHALAPLTNPAVIRAKMVEHLIIREVLDQEEVSESIGTRALSFYEDHEDLLGWSSRYWDQRALLESNVEGHFSRAYSYSQKAISLERHAFAYTSFGSICLSHALRILDRERFSALKYFKEGEEALSMAVELADRKGMSHEHPYVKFFSASTVILRRLDPTDTEFGMIIQLFEVWLARADGSKAFATSHGVRRLKEVRATLVKYQLRARKALKKPGS
ncbi:P-loop NTPase [Xanthomonas campestris]|uniref:P-loop NTPase n=1 Tax=Xanthomonas campestris TaxID=339 RepID=UPI0023E9A2CD|nr:hypothetical protein [Xanthomonas campestris]